MGRRRRRSVNTINNYDFVSDDDDAVDDECDNDDDDHDDDNDDGCAWAGGGEGV